MTSHEHTVEPIQRTKFNLNELAANHFSIWVIIGFLFWIGFYIGALIMHAVNK